MQHTSLLILSIAIKISAFLSVSILAIIKLRLLRSFMMPILICSFYQKIREAC